MYILENPDIYLFMFQKVTRAGVKIHSEFPYTMQISAKDLGELKMGTFCARCFWIKRHDRELPFQTPFAGIFSSIDSYTKEIVERYFNSNGKMPDWLGEVGNVTSIVQKPHTFEVEMHRIKLTGVPDAIFRLESGEFVIVDYKTGRYTETQRSLLPIYETQLNGYAYIAEKVGVRPVKSIYLAYFEPPTRSSTDTLKYTAYDGFAMPFKVSIHEIKKETKSIDLLMKAAAEIYYSEEPPKGRSGCKECMKLEKLVKTLHANSVEDCKP